MTDTQTRRQVAGAVQYRAAAASSYDPQAHTVELVLATETPVLTPGWRIGLDGPYYEILDMSPGAVDLSQVAAGNCPALMDHDWCCLDSRLGVIDQASIQDRTLVTRIQFSTSEQALEMEAELAGPAPPKASAGYQVTELMLERFDADIPVYRATRWVLREGSFVSLAADLNAGVRADHGLTPCVIMETRAMREDNNAAGSSAGETENTTTGGGTETVVTPGDGQRALAPVISTAAAPAALTVMATLALLDQARSLGVEPQARAAIEAAGATEASVSAVILQQASARQAAQTGGVSAFSAGRAGDERENTRLGLQAALVVGMRGGQARVYRPHDNAAAVRVADNAQAQARAAEEFERARPHMGLGIAEIAALCLGERALPRSAADRLELFSRAFHVTSDFPNLLSNALNQRLLEQYVVATPVYRRIAQQMTFMDFRSHDLIRVGDFPGLQPVAEDGEIKFGTFGDKKESAVVASYGVQFGLSRQLLINDRLNGIDQALASYGIQVALFEEKTFFAMKNVSSGVGPTLVEDGTAVFTSGHGNYTGTGTAITNAALGIGRASLRKMKNLQGDQIGVGPSILLVSPDKETEAQSILWNLQGASAAANANIFSGSLELLVGGQLTGNAWELYPDISVGSNWIWGHLDGYDAPRLTMEQVFGMQGVKAQVEHDFGCGAQDFRYGYRNLGA
jgi:hypothetical protein